MIIAIISATIAVSIWRSALELDRPPKISAKKLEELEAKLDRENARLDEEIYGLLKEHRRLCGNGKKGI